MDSAEAAVAALETAIKTSRNISFASVAGITIMTLDWLLTLHHEIRLIWFAKWNITKVLYLFARYLPFVDFPLILRYQFGSLNVDQCQNIYNVSAALFVACVVFAELILTIRTWAVWSKGRFVAIGLFGTFALSWAAVVILVGIYLKGTHHEAPHLAPLIGCILLSAGSDLEAIFIVIAFYDTVMLSLMTIQGVSVFRSGGDSHLFRTIYGDGISFYVYLVALSIINLVIIFRFTDFVTFLVMLQGAIHSVLACRVVLHIRHQSRVPTYAPEDTAVDWANDTDFPQGRVSSANKVLAHDSADDADDHNGGDNGGSTARHSGMGRPSSIMVLEIT